MRFFCVSRECINTKLTQIGEQFCGLDVNTPLGGELPIKQEPPVLTFSAQLTAVTATSTGKMDSCPSVRSRLYSLSQLS
jgi:hypothetical protein